MPLLVVMHINYLSIQETTNTAIGCTAIIVIIRIYSEINFKDNYVHLLRRPKNFQVQILQTDLYTFP